MALVDSEVSEPIIGCGIRVHRALGPGFLEAIYEEAMAIELAAHRLTFERQKSVPIQYNGRGIGLHRLDFLVGGKVVLELKACTEIDESHLATTRSYLKATGLQLGLVLNFAQPVLKIRRVILT